MIKSLIQRSISMTSSALTTGVLVGMMVVPSTALAERCNDAELWGPKILTEICWECIFPITILGQQLDFGNDADPPDRPGVISGTLAAGSFGEGAEVLDDAAQTDTSFSPNIYNNNAIPAGASNDIICNCPNSLGIPRLGMNVSMWEPARVIEMVRNPGCAPAMNGITLPMSKFRKLNSIGEGDLDPHDKVKFWNYHYYAFPLMIILELFTDFTCSADGYADFDLLYLSEFDPTWNSQELAFFVNPESIVVAGLPAQLACMLDNAVTAVGGNPIDSLFWCAGGWGMLYPLSGISDTESTVTDTQLGALRAVAALHRRGLARQTMGDEAACSAPIQLMMPRSQYKWTMFHPKPESNRAHRSGESYWSWGLNREQQPFRGEDFVYVAFRWRDCCVF